jgi:hypothetical protein
VQTPVVDAEEAEDLESGLASAFWRRFRAHIDQEWGPKGDVYLQAIKTAMNNVDDVMQRRQLEQVMFAQQEILRLAGWPQQRLNVLRQNEDDVPHTLKDKMLALRQQDQHQAVQSRRGRL